MDYKRFPTPANTFTGAHRVQGGTITASVSFTGHLIFSILILHFSTAKYYADQLQAEHKAMPVNDRQHHEALALQWLKGL